MIFRILILVSLNFGANYLDSNTASNYLGLNIPDTLILVGIMVDFPKESPDNPKTSGNGEFLNLESSEYNHFYDSKDPRCDGFLVDRPPHDSLYFHKQLEAVGNYYLSVSDNQLPFSANIITNSNGEKYYTVANTMEYYAKSDKLLAQFFTEALELAALDIENSKLKIDSALFVVFHAGLSQDFSYPSFDPTIYDLKSAYVDEQMMEGVDPAVVSSYPITNGIILPETQNIIYFDVSEDIFGNPDYGTDSFCDIQIGLTGIFSFLVGYHLGLPELFNLETGDAGIGRFGLMDHGSNNGRGVIPAPPSPWTRSLPFKNWSIIETINPQESDSSIYIFPLDSLNRVIRVNISDNEYFLVENRNNWVDYKVDIDSLRRENQIGENIGYWFDAVTENFTENQIEIDPSTGVITKFDHYDYGLPGSGILIWHIVDPQLDLFPAKAINDKLFKHVQLKEADGSQDIGETNFAFFSSDDPTLGTRWDYWFLNNEGFKFSNPDLDDEVILDYYSSPNSRSVENSDSFLSIQIQSMISDTMKIKINFNERIEIINFDSANLNYLGNSFNEADSSSAIIYYSKNDSIFKYTSFSDPIHLDTIIFNENNKIYSYLDSIAYLSHNSCLHPQCLEYEDDIHPLGYIENIIDSTSFSSALSFGDIDQDGLDEILLINENNDIIVQNSNKTLVSGFPVRGNFSGIPLVANILNVEDGLPEIICREGNSITIISSGGDRLREYSSFSNNQSLAMVPFWNKKMALIDGSRLFLFDLDLKNSFWLNPNSRPSGFPVSTGVHFNSSSTIKSSKIAYNYPNPIIDGSTTFRFYVEDHQNMIEINIYNAAGFLIDEIVTNDLTPNEFNELSWNTTELNSGLYLAEIKFEKNISQLLRVVVIK